MAPHLDRETASPVLFIVSVLAVQILGILALVLTGIWMNHYLGGFGWDGTGHEFDYHPLCMVISLVFLYSEGKIFIVPQFKCSSPPGFQYVQHAMPVTACRDSQVYTGPLGISRADQELQLF